VFLYKGLFHTIYAVNSFYLKEKTMALSYIKISLVFLVATVICSAGIAQQAKKPATTFTKFKPPVVKSYLGNYTGATNCSPEEGKQAILQALKIADEKNNNFTIASYQFAYRRLGITEDEATGAVTPAKDMVAQRFTETPLPEIWKSNITEQLHKGEELYFFDIIVYDKQGRRFFAPELKITIQ
jgi:hypothetical protein